MITEIKSFRYPITYKTLADRVTNANLEDILSEVQRRCPTQAAHEASSCTKKGKNGTVNVNGELSEPQFRAIENFRRRIYDAWSVLRASGIIEKVDERHFQFNKEFLMRPDED